MEIAYVRLGGLTMKEHVYLQLWKRFERFAKCFSKKEQTEFDGELDRLAGWIAETGIESWPPPEHLVLAANEEAAARGRA